MASSQSHSRLKIAGSLIQADEPKNTERPIVPTIVVVISGFRYTALRYEEAGWEDSNPAAGSGPNAARNSSEVSESRLSSDPVQQLRSLGDNLLLVAYLPAAVTKTARGKGFRQVWKGASTLVLAVKQACFSVVRPRLLSLRASSMSSPSLGLACVLQRELYAKSRENLVSSEKPSSPRRPFFRASSVARLTAAFNASSVWLRPSFLRLAAA
jgi:hypothetical protein